MDAFLRTRSRAIRIHGLPEGTTRASLGGWLASASSITEFQGAAPSTWKVVESIWKEEEGDGGGGGWRVVLAEHATVSDFCLSSERVRHTHTHPFPSLVHSRLAMPLASTRPGFSTR